MKYLPMRRVYHCFWKGKCIMPVKNISRTKEYQGHPLSQQEHTFNTRYLNRGIKMIDSMSSRHSKVLQTRMDFRYPKEIQSDGSNQDFQKTLQSLSRELTRKKYDPQYIARREQISSHNSHLHLALMVDGNKCRCADTLNRIAEKHWANTLGMPEEEVHRRKLVYPCNHDPQGNPRPNSYLLERRNPGETKAKMIQQLSYLAKVDERDVTPSRIRKFFCSQFAKDEAIAREKREKWLLAHPQGR